MDNVENVETTDQEETGNHIQDLIKAALEKDYNNANKTFGEVMTIKMSDLLDQEKIRMASQVYNGVEEDEEELEDEDIKDEEDEEELEDEDVEDEDDNSV